MRKNKLVFPLYFYTLSCAGLPAIDSFVFWSSVFVDSSWPNTRCLDQYGYAVYSDGIQGTLHPQNSCEYVPIILSSRFGRELILSSLPWVPSLPSFSLLPASNTKLIDRWRRWRWRRVGRSKPPCKTCQKKGVKDERGYLLSRWSYPPQAKLRIYRNTC